MILRWKRFYGDNLGEKTASYCIAMSMPHVDKINEAPDNVWEVHFLSLEVLRSIDVPVMNEAAIEDFEIWSDDEPTVSSTQESIQEMSSGRMNSLLSRLYALRTTIKLNVNQSCLVDENCYSDGKCIGGL